MSRSAGRHRKVRMTVRPAVRVAVVAGFVVAAGATAATWPGAAVADAPVQTAWWNAMSGGGEAAPSPTTPEGGLRASAAPGEILAFGAVQYLFAPGSSGTLELKVADSTGLPEINPNSPSTDPSMPVVACPTKGTWEAGDDQDIESAPEVDCTIRSFIGSFSADGKTVTFLVDDGGQELPGSLSLAILPVTTNDAPAGLGTELPADVTSPMVVDFAKPEATSLTVTAPYSPPDDGITGGGTGGTGTTTGAGGTGGTGGTGSAGAPPTVDVGDLPPAATGTPADPPVVAPEAPVAASGTGTPVAAVAPTKDTAHNVALALLVLLGLLLLATNSGQLQRSPRLLGGAARHAGAAGDAAATAAPVPVAVYGTRGLGRFNKPRNGPPRPLI